MKTYKTKLEVSSIFNILLTCDDGINSLGLLNLIKSVMRPDVRLFVCAPDTERSAASHSLTFHSPLIVKKVNLLSDESVECWQVSGTPCDCVKLAIENFMPQKPDLLISGINNGLNLGSDIYYSGTVSAAREGTLNQIPSIAFSVESQDDKSFEITQKMIDFLMKRVLSEGLPVGTFLNVNVPKSACVEKSMRIAITSVGDLKYSKIFDERVDPRGRKYFWLSGSPVLSAEGENEDVGCINGGYISLSPLKIDLTNYEFFEKLKGWNLK